LVAKSHRALLSVLRDPEYEYLKKEYGQTKIRLATSSVNRLDYGRKKREVIRRILKAAGWTDDDVDAKEGLDVRVVREDEPAY
jgi:hypothetical protein